MIPSLGGAIYAYVKHGDTYQKTLQSKKVNLIFISLAFFVGLLVFLFNAIGVPIIIAKVHGISKGKGSFSVGPAVSALLVHWALLMLFSELSVPARGCRNFPDHRGFHFRFHGLVSNVLFETVHCS